MMQLAASLPVVGLPVPEQQVSEPVPRGQREHLLLQFDHGPPPHSPKTDITANCTSTPRRWTPQKSTSLLFLLLFKTEINNEHIDTSHGIVFDLPPKWEKNIYFFRFWAPITMQLYFLFPPRQQVEFIRRCVGEAPLLLWQLESNWLSLSTAASSQPELRMDALAANLCRLINRYTVLFSFNKKKKKQQLQKQYTHKKLQYFRISGLLLHRDA